jgi:hypothetical protein
MKTNSIPSVQKLEVLGDDATAGGRGAPAALIESALNSLGKRVKDGKFFPNGITKISLSSNTSEGFGFNVEGPDKCGALNYYGDNAMEEFTPPTPNFELGDPVAANEFDVNSLTITIKKSIIGAASLYSGACLGGDRYQNNCAHFLSDAFIKAGFSELSSPSPCIDVHCATSAARPIRARNRWCWFEKMARESRTALPKNEGLWAVFQLDERQYWGGHVVIIDTDRNIFYGTGNYPRWKQFCYRW